MIAPLQIFTERFVLRPLVESDVTMQYLLWLNQDKAKKFITTAASINSLSKLREYVADKNQCNDVLFLGIFDKENGLHIGNIKYEPVNIILRYAVMGILIGDSTFRGKGIAIEVVLASSAWLKENYNINQILLGVSSENSEAVRAYHRAGFKETDTPFIHKYKDNYLLMALQI